MLKLIPVFLGFLLLIGCALNPSQREMMQAEFGQVPNNYKYLIQEKIRKDDPGTYSAKIDVPPPYPAVRNLGVLKGGGYEYGHVVHAWVTTKNEWGHDERRFPRIFWWNSDGWSTMLPSLHGITPRYREQAEEYVGTGFPRY